jgi:4-amino-4-deoxy-L-arabinose transferase-like glycosyltransferase
MAARENSGGTIATRARDARASSFFASDIAILVLIAAAVCVLHIATNGHYGFHRDELQTLDDARHLDWGYVVYPPITPLIARLELILFGTSLIGFRVFSAVAVSLVVFLVGLIAKELGGTRHVQVLAAVAAAISPVSLIQGAVFQYVSFDYLCGALLFYFLVRLLKSGDPRWWVAVGITLGLGMETRYTMGFLALGLVAALLLTPERSALRSKWLWVGAGISVLIFLPNLLWQARHDFISLTFLQYLHKRDAEEGRYAGFFREQLYVCVNIVTAPLALSGLSFLLRHPAGRRYRMIGVMLLVTFLLFAIPGARSYYAATLYLPLLAAGSVMLGIWLAGLRPLPRRFVFGAQWALIAIGGVAFCLIALPIVPVGSPVWRITSKVYDQFREEVGWPDLAQSVAKIYFSLPPQERADTGVLAGNYGEAGALNLYGPALGLPHTMALTNSFWYRGYDPRQPQTVIVVGFTISQANRAFASCTIAGKNTNPFGVPNEESVDHPDIYLCRDLRLPWPEFWVRSRRYG